MTSSNVATTTESSAELGSMIASMPSNLKTDNTAVMNTLLVDGGDDDITISQMIGRHMAKKYNMQCFTSCNVSSEVSIINLIAWLEEILKEKLKDLL